MMLPAPLQLSKPSPMRGVVWGGLSSGQVSLVGPHRQNLREKLRIAWQSVGLWGSEGQPPTGSHQIGRLRHLFKPAIDDRLSALLAIWSSLTQNKRRG